MGIRKGYFRSGRGAVGRKVGGTTKVMKGSRGHRMPEKN